MNPLISVIIPVHSSVDTVGAAIESIANQTYRNLEIIVINDNGPDQIRLVVEKLAKKYSNLFYYALPFDDLRRTNKRGRNVNAGYSARNYGFEKAKGEWITFQDADDVSLRNRIEVEYFLATHFNALHVCIEWQQLTPERIGKTFDFKRVLEEEPNVIIDAVEISRRAKATKGIAMRFLGPFRKYISFEFKTMRFFNKLFFGSLDSYPGSGNSPLFRKEVLQFVRFRNVDERVWPSFTGRGADRDFNFQVAETFGKSMSFKLPLYLWRVDRENDLGYDFNKYLLK